MDYKELLAYQKSFKLAIEIFESSKSIEIGKLINYMINNPNKFGCKI